MVKLSSGGINMKRIHLTAAVALLLSLAASLMAVAADSPKVVYEKYIKKIKAKDKSAILEYVTAEKKKEFEGFEEVKQDQLMALLQAFAPLSCQVLKEEIKGDKATLTLDGKGKSITGEVEKMTGTVLLLKEKGEWKIEKESWKSSNSGKKTEK